MQKIKIGHQAKFQLFSAGFVSGSSDITPYFYFRCVARATIDRNSILSADTCFLVMACIMASARNSFSFFQTNKHILSLDTVRVIISRRNLARVLRTHRRFLTLYFPPK